MEATFDLGNDDERLRQEGEGTAEEATPKTGVTNEAIPVVKCGISTMLQVDECSQLQHGSVDIGPSLNIGRFLDPLQGPPSEPSGNNGRAEEPSVHVSFDEFVSLAQTLSYEKCDLELARRIYEAVESSGRDGISEETLSKTLVGGACVPRGKMTISDIIQDLLNFEMVQCPSFITTPTFPPPPTYYRFFIILIDFFSWCFCSFVRMPRGE